MLGVELRGDAQPRCFGPLDIAPLLDGAAEFFALRFGGVFEERQFGHRRGDGLLPGGGAGCVAIGVAEHASTRRDHDVRAVFADENGGEPGIDARAGHGKHRPEFFYDCPKK